ncbi:hypothetical protein ZIOFF_013135 [Zingiber officinale]|uniref:Uncharacterized protein n=1 Tax=Zingiber officinale TaxID=94328 RepID=A0A8J5HQZ9_ZINOF|nr:hypothetical protein ZIOFF_013135 [Zingiber officinale]
MVLLLFPNSPPSSFANLLNESPEPLLPSRSQREERSSSPLCPNFFDRILEFSFLFLPARRGTSSLPFSKRGAKESIQKKIGSEKHWLEKDITEYIKEFNSKYGQTWHYFIGRNFDRLLSTVLLLALIQQIDIQHPSAAAGAAETIRLHQPTEYLPSKQLDIQRLPVVAAETFIRLHRPTENLPSSVSSACSKTATPIGADRLLSGLLAALILQLDKQRPAASATFQPGGWKWRPFRLLHPNCYLQSRVSGVYSKTATLA